MTQYRKNLGKLGEELAAQFLIKKGYKIIDKNFLIRGGEIDIVTIQNGVLVFVEVKTRVGSNFGLPEEAISFWKLKALIKTAQFYQAKNPHLPEEQRIDVVAVELDQSGNLKRIEVIENVTG